MTVPNDRQREILRLIIHKARHPMNVDGYAGRQS